MFHIERKSLTCPNTTIYGYTNRYTNGVPHWGTPCFKVTPVECLSEEFLDIQATVEYEFTLKRARDMIET